MTVTSVNELPDQRGGGEDDKGSRSYSRVYIVETNNKNDGVESVLNAVGLPQFGDIYQTGSELNQLAKVNSRTPRQMTGSRTTWRVDIQYTTKKSDGEERDEDDPEDDADPLLRHDVIAWAFEAQQVTVPGAFGKQHVSLSDRVVSEGGNIGMLNSAGEPFDPPPTFTESHPVVTITRNEETFNAKQAIEFQDTVNDQFWAGVEAKQARIVSITTPGRVVERLANNVVNTYFPVTYTIAFREKTWAMKVLDQGTFFWTGSSVGDGVTRPFATTDGTHYVGNLDGKGLKLAVGSTAEFVTFDVYKAKDFTQIKPPLPQGF